MRTIYIPFNLLLLILIKWANGETIMLSSNSGKSGTNLIMSQKYYRKFQLPYSYAINGASNVYAKVTGLGAVFYHTEPTLFNIKFEANCHITSDGGSWVFPRIMVDDLLIYNDKLIKNTEDRYRVIPGFADVHTFDHIGAGHYLYYHRIAPVISKSELIYLQPGIHAIDVAVRAIGNMPVDIYYGVLTIEVTQYAPGAHIGELIPMNTTAISLHG